MCRSWSGVGAYSAKAEAQSESKISDSAHLCSSAVYQRWPESHFQTPTSLLFQNFWIRVRNLRPAIFQIWESDSCSKSSCNHRSNPTLSIFLLKKWPHTHLLLPKLKSDGRSWSGFSQIFDSGSERNTQKPAGVDSGNPVSSEISDLCGISDSFLFFSYFPSQNKEI